MKQLIRVFAPLVLVALVSCATKPGAPIAEISVFVGDPPQPEQLDEFHLMNQKTILSSHDFAMHLENKFMLSKTWGMSPEAACQKIMGAITVDVGGDAGRYVVGMPGIEHKQTVELLNELCDYYSQRDNLVSWDENSNPRRMTVTIFSRAY
ncbi:MAG TPA: hypothetical protein VK742_02620 [Candidatus Sulfotelmatobacter sp.]|nr:hypothetical protein [Candidatus Sulfotelmatobacter sp.]